MADAVRQDLGETLAPGPTRIQMCGRLVATVHGRRVDPLLPGRQGRLLFAYLVANRRRPATRSELAEALWPREVPAAIDTALSALLTKSRGALGASALIGKHDIRLVLPPDAWIDLESALEAVHRAESAVALGDWTRGWGPAMVTLHIAKRRFLPGYDGPWIEKIRKRMEDALLRTHECIATIGLHMRGAELVSAERSARALIELAPYRESGYRLLMEVLAERGNLAEALLAYESLRRLLREELGAAPSAATQALHKRLLQGQSGAGTALARELKTVLFTDIVGATDRAAAVGDRSWRELLERHHATVREQLGRFAGQEIDTAGDGFLATFESPAIAVGCACRIVASVAQLGIEVRAGIHIGECEVQGGRVSGIAVHVGARIAAAAGPSEVLVSSTVKDLVSGSGIDFADHGTHLLKGVPGDWRLFAVKPESLGAALTDGPIASR